MDLPLSKPIVRTRPRLLLFDIDGTLLNVAGHYSYAVIGKSFRDIFAVEVDFSEGRHEFGGKTDLQIFVEIGKEYKISEEEIRRNAIRIAEMVALHTEEVLQVPHVQILPGVKHLFALLQEQKRALNAVVTGNVKGAALHKLKMVDLHNHFLGGSFGCDHHERQFLPSIAVQRVNETLKSNIFSLEDCIIIGDTPRDIDCAVRNDIPCIAIATGKYSIDELHAHSPTMLFASMVELVENIENIYSL